MTIRGLQRLLMILGGKVATGFRELVEGTFTRIMAGDQSLIEVINANAVSQAPLQQAYRTAVAQEPVAPILEEFCGIKKREREDLLFDLDIVERKQRFQLEMEHERQALDEKKQALEERKQRLQLEVEERRLTSASDAVTTIDSFKEKKYVDNRTKMQFEDHIKNVFLSPQSLVTRTTTTTTTTALSQAQSSAPGVAGGEVGASQTGLGAGQAATTTTTTQEEVVVNQSAGLTVSVLAKDMGLNITTNDGKLIGKIMAKKYRAKYGEEPSKHLQSINGAALYVNSYIQRDKAMMEEAIHEFMAK
jgi:hypothetical protein